MTETPPWRRFNLRASPFFNEPLGVSDARPLHLMVGREAEVEHMLRSLRGSGSSRQMVMAAPGVGKTTFVERVKADAASAGFLSRRDPVPVVGPGGTQGLLIRLLSYLHDVLQAAYPHPGTPIAASAELLAGAQALRSAFGPRGEGADRVPQVLTAGWALFEELARALRRLPSHPGIVIHLEVVATSAAEVEAAARAIRDLRDLLLEPGCHFIAEGETRTVGAVLGRHPQVHDVFGLPTVLLPLEAEEVHELLARRCSFLRLDPGRPWTPPVDAIAVEKLYAAVRGNLGRMLEVLDRATHRVDLESKTHPTPVQYSAVRKALRSRQQ
jgi:hypothetical protein